MLHYRVVGTIISVLVGIQLMVTGCQSPKPASPTPTIPKVPATPTTTPSPAAPTLQTQPTQVTPQTQPTPPTVAPVPSPTPQPTQQIQITPVTPQTQPTTPASSPAREEFQVEVVLRNLDIPWSLAFAPDGRLFFTERPGRIMVFEQGKAPSLVATVEVARQSEAGLLGLTLSPNFSQDHYLYVHYTYRDGTALKNRVVRFIEQGGKAINPVVLLENIPGSGIHDGGRLRFGPDGTLYITAGDSSNSELAQDPRSLAGKILRINPDGSIPADNPFPGSPVYSFGHRNPQGLDWHPVTGQLYEVEHGPTAHDELNLIIRGSNYGWPRVVGSGNNPQFINPLLESGTGTWAPSGATFYRGSRLVGWQNSFFFAALRGEALHRVTFKGQELKEIDVHQVLLGGTLGRLRDVAEGPDGFLYIATNNRDGRGRPTEEDDRILRIVASGN